MSRLGESVADLEPVEFFMAQLRLKVSEVTGKVWTDADSFAPCGQDGNRFERGKGLGNILEVFPME